MDSLSDAPALIATIIKHDARVTSYKLALLRAVNDLALAFPGLERRGTVVAVPLRMLARRWIGYYWPFVDARRPILQGQHVAGRSDISFRPNLAELRTAWEQLRGGSSSPSDGHALVADLAMPRRRVTYPAGILALEEQAVRAISRALGQPIRYAGPGEWSVFPRPARYASLGPGAVPLPGTRPEDTCLIMRSDLWKAFVDLSLWIEALVIHEWSLFTARLPTREEQPLDRGEVFRLLTGQPEGRRSLSWERGQVDRLLAGGAVFTCPWTGRVITRPRDYDLDHLVPISVAVINDLWNLVPADPRFNTHSKRDLLPSPGRLDVARPILAETYGLYLASPPLASVLAEDAGLRFTDMDRDSASPNVLANAVVAYIGRVADARQVRRFP